MHGTSKPRQEEGDLQLLDVLEYLAGTSLFESSHGLRKGVFDAACRLREPRAVGFLIRHLERIDGQLQYDVVEHLRRVTRQPLTVDVESWSRWWGRAGRDFQFPAEMASTQPFSREGSPLYYYDVAVHARRLVFLLDTSKSMGAGGNVSRLEAAKRELIKTIERLPAEARFNVILFHSSIHKWSDHLQPATDAAKTTQRISRRH